MAYKITVIITDRHNNDAPMTIVSSTFEYDPTGICSDTFKEGVEELHKSIHSDDGINVDDLRTSVSIEEVES